METFMRWELKYRDSNDLQLLVRKIPDNLVERATVEGDIENLILYLRLQRRC